MAAPGSAEPIDRQELVARHGVRLRRADPLTPLTVGNGQLAFTVDVTGLQSLADLHASGMPLGTHAHWGWHCAPNPERFVLAETAEDYRDANGRLVRFFTTGGRLDSQRGEQRVERARMWLRQNPHRLHLGRVGLTHPGGRALNVGEVGAIDQQLDLWEGVIRSQFELNGVSVRVTTVCHPDRDLLALRIESPLLANGALQVQAAFPYAVGDWRDPCDWESPDAHRTELSVRGRRADVVRILDADRHHVALCWSPGARLRLAGPHRLTLTSDAERLEVRIGFSPDPLPADLPSVTDCLEAARRHWSAFWSSGGAIDLAGSEDPRAGELERRIVLSQYLTALHCAGTTPPAETGLVTNSWSGKFHLEMHWWHAAHFVLWGRAELLERSLAWYKQSLPQAREYAYRQGFEGARWPKQVGPEARESPSDIGPFLVWQQPHLVYFAELLWRQRQDRATLDEWAELVFATAEFMASYPTWDAAEGRYSLGPPLASAQEKAVARRAESRNPAFELAYWTWALGVAQRWRMRLGLDPLPAWDEVANRLARLPSRGGRYVELEHPATGPEGHPTMVGALGFVPDTGRVDHAIMDRTLRSVLDGWDWSDAWGWDFPLLAMTACRLERPDLAVDCLLLNVQKNTYLANGHNYQETRRLPLYLPGNGGLLFAAAMMAGGWDGASRVAAPGFPSRGWSVRAEGLHPAP